MKLRRASRRAASGKGCQKPDLIDVDKTSWHRGAPRSRPGPDGMPWLPGKEGAAPRQQVHVLIKFPCEVQGPLLLGAGTFCGYGLCKPLWLLTQMNSLPLTSDDFPAFFRELWGADCDPFPWQCQFARRLCEGQVPDYVAVPTGSGKTACLDAAVFALGVQATSPMTERTQGRRIFFIVNRRVIVDEAYDRARKLCKKMRDAAPGSVVGRVRAALHKLSGESHSPPLAHAQLRGGIYRERSWAARCSNR